jgi:hypothetical protein
MSGEEHILRLRDSGMPRRMTGLRREEVLRTSVQELKLLTCIRETTRTPPVLTEGFCFLCPSKKNYKTVP